ncbi:uncharacterized protein LOC110699547 [Chenopodium quinoa]|uniref:uncharacterized protein LOC110699547 n=1 Tax=Chenopodium quinoa TaxID=63459 RepID=UPI000B789D8F|nr:uncharacterized protein LOC110699547 [Chenopodium quinoa]
MEKGTTLKIPEVFKQYKDALLDYERYKTSSDGSSILSSLAVPIGAENQVKIVVQGFPSLALIRMPSVLHLKLKFRDVQVPIDLRPCIEAVGARILVLNPPSR